MAKSKRPAGAYIAATGLSDDKSGKQWAAGDVVQAGDFPADVIAAWLEQKILTQAETAEASDGGSSN